MAGTGSMVVAVLDTTLVSVPVSGARTWSAYVCVWPAASEPIAGHCTTAPLSAPPLEALTKVAPAGIGSLTSTAVAALGPMLVTVIV